MIADSQEAFESLISTVPDFRPRYQRFLADWLGEATPWYLAMGELAHYVVDTYEQGDTTKYVELFSSIESVLENGDSEVQNLIRVGLLEDSRILRAIAASVRTFFVSDWVRKATVLGTN